MKTWADFNIQVPSGAAGPQVYTTCPQCSPHRKKKNVKCLSVNLEESIWLCHHCGWDGTLKEGVRTKADPFKWQEKTYAKPKYELKTAIPSEVVEWFHKRGISDNTLLRNKIRYESVYMPQVEGFKDAIRFPFLRNGEVINVKSRTLDKEFRLETNAERIFYGMDDVIADEAIIVEGEIDKLSVEEAGLLHCLSVPDGAPSPRTKDYTNKFTFLENCDELIERVKTFILAVDNDEAGQKLEEELARRLGKHKCKRVQWPEGCKDANEVLLKYGANELLKYIKMAREFPVEGVYEISDIIPQIDALYNRPFAGGKPTGWTNLDHHYTVKTGEWTLVTGIPGHGKSEWVDALMIKLVDSAGWSFAIFSPENQPLELHFAKLAEKWAEKPWFAPNDERLSRGELALAKHTFQNHFTFVLPPEDKLTVDGILELCKHVILKKGIKGVVIDPWNEIDHSRPSALSETEYISKSLSKIRRFVREYGLHLWLVAHPVKLRKRDDGLYPVPTPYDVSGSAHFRNKADNCITVYRDMSKDTSEVEIHVQKVRFKNIGKVGMITLHYDKKTGLYREAI
jgi:twinkle protein